MFDAVAARRMMVDGQVRTADVTNLELIGAMLAVPRERFVSSVQAQLAYCDGDVPIGGGRVLLKPMVLAKLIQALRLSDDDHVLDLGCGTGYSSAVLARLVGSVVALEQDEALAQRAKQALAATGEAPSVTIAVGPLTAGWSTAAPYDAILVNGAVEVLPDALAQQLKPSGRLACVFGRPPDAKAMIYRPIEGKLVGRPIFDAAEPVLPGFAAAPAFVF